MWFRRASPLLNASVYFRGTLAPRAENIRALQSPGLGFEILPNTADTQWSVLVSHSHWGAAELRCPRNAILPPDELIEYCSQLTDAEKREMRAAGSSIEIRLLKTSEHLLRDRKTLLRFCGLVMGEEGVAASDNVSQLFWARESLHDELSHEADLDITGLYVLHAVQEPGSEKCFWAHSHGLGEIGFWDFDILRPGEGLLSRGSDTFRALAFLSVEGQLHPHSGGIKIFHPGGVAFPVAAGEFQKSGHRTDTALREPDEGHRRRRVVLCEPVTIPFRWFKRPQPANALSGEFPDRVMVPFSLEATRLMAARAQATCEVLRRLAAEFADLKFPTLVKLGLQTDDNKGREHLWFEAQSFREGSVIATLMSAPYGIARLTAGTSGEWPIEELSDWTIMTPKGSVTPANLRAAREVRAHRDEVVRIMSESRRLPNS